MIFVEFLVEEEACERAGRWGHGVSEEWMRVVRRGGKT